MFLQHIADACILDMEKLYPVCQLRGQFAGGTPKLFEEKLAKARIGIFNLNGLDGFLDVKPWEILSGKAKPQPVRRAPTRPGLNSVFGRCS